MVFGEEPAYRRIANDLRNRIGAGEFAAGGGALPSRFELCAHYGVSETVARQAVHVLVSEGWAITRPGAGTFVRERPEVTRILRTPRPERGRGSPFRADMEDRGHSGTWRSKSSTTTAPPEVAERLGIDPGDRVMRTVYVFLADDEPVMLSTSWEPLAITGATPILLPEEGPLAGKGVVDRMAAIGVRVAESSEVVSTRPASADEAERLGEPLGAPVLTIERTYWDTDGRPVETADIVVPGSRRELEYRTVFPLDDE
ncbi:GntR family transcriptional regulator [Embleya sp. NPDC059259]|uniref:GntR family transcriptional regulator n=1 Tax=unclassified Embleya TaxID=2699296 RepID=UPI0036A156AB